MSSDMIDGAGSSMQVVGNGPPTNQHALMSAAMLDAKRARMKVESDRQALANRIARLQSEELRATKRIEQTHRRTQEILDAKNRHHHQQTEKERARMEQEAIVMEHKKELAKVREERKQALQVSKAKLLLAAQGAVLKRVFSDQSQTC